MPRCQTTGAVATSAAAIPAPCPHTSISTLSRNESARSIAGRNPVAASNANSRRRSRTFRSSTAPMPSAPSNSPSMPRNWNVAR